MYSDVPNGAKSRRCLVAITELNQALLGAEHGMDHILLVLIFWHHQKEQTCKQLSVLLKEWTQTKEKGSVISFEVDHWLQLSAIKLYVFLYI